MSQEVKEATEIKATDKPNYTIKTWVGVDKKGRKAMLVGVRPFGSSCIAWGISRKATTDKFDRELGFKIAFGRACVALDEIYGSVVTDDVELYVLSQDGMKGICGVKHLSDLRIYFGDMCRLTNF